MPPRPRQTFKSSKAKATKSVSNDTQSSNLAAPVPSPPLPVKVWRTHSRVPAKDVNDAQQERQEGSSNPAPPLPSRPSTGKGRRTRSRVPVVVNRDSDEEFRLSDVTSGDGDSPQVEPTPEGGLLTPQSNTLGTSTLDSDAGRPVSDVAHFFKGFENEDGLVMRRCDECLNEGLSEAEAHCYGPNTASANLRKHLFSKHLAAYMDAAKKHNWTLSKSLDGQDKPAQGGSPHRQLPEYSNDVFIQYLIRFIVADDQSLRVVDCPEFRDICWLLRPNLEHLPHRDSIRERVTVEWGKAFTELRDELVGSCGRISFTADIWSSATLVPYLAVTSHWISQDANNNLSLKAALIGFMRLTKAHTGKNIAEAILSLIDRAGVTYKIGHFTLDNASNNATAMKELQALLVQRDVVFDNLNNRVMCYPHIINICTAHIVAASTQVSKKYLDSNGWDNGDDDDDDDDIDTSSPYQTGPQLDEAFIASQPLARQAWLRSLSRDPVRLVADIVHYIRASDSRKQSFAGIVALCTKDDPGSRGAPPLQLIQHIRTRWDSVYLMLQHFRVLRKAVEMYMATEPSTQSMRLCDTDWELLESIEGVLEAAHVVLQTMSSETTPVLCGSIASFELLMTQWERLGEEHPELRYWTRIGLRWAQKYYTRMDDTNAYVIAMVLNPAIRFLWIQREWESTYIQRSKKIMLDLMLKYREENPSLVQPAQTQARPVLPSYAKTATRFQLKDHPIYPALDSPDQSEVEDEFAKYTSAPLTSEKTNILVYWQAHKAEFPTLYAIAMDYLPIQASSVPCERVFSSAGETDTKKRNRISPALMEALQMLKFLLKKKRLDFTAGWKTAEAAMLGEIKTEVESRSGITLNSLLGGDIEKARDQLLSDDMNYDD